MRRLRILSFVFTAALCVAEDRALVVGVGKYADPSVPSLPGINLDTQMYTNVLGQLGFQPSQIHCLMDSQSTLANIRGEIQNWLATAGPNDRACFYFSGHGSLSLDEQGKEIAVLVPHDVRIGQGRLLNALGGPDLGAMMSSLKTRNVLIVADACHSGHMTDSSKGLGRVPKFLTYRGMPTGARALAVSRIATKGIAFKGIGKDNQMNHMLFSACRREEVAGATQKGSVLTVAISAMVDELVKNGKPVTMAGTHQLVVALLKGRDQHPELSGDSDLQQANWVVNGGTGNGANVDGGGNNSQPQTGGGDWDLIQRVYTLRTGDVNVRVSKPVYRNGEKMTIDVDVPSGGYVNIIAMGSKDSAATVLFPNQYVSDNRVGAGTLHVPNTGAYFLSQEAPGGDEDDELVVIVSQQEMNLYKQGVGKEQFRKLTKRTRSTVVRPSDNNGYSAGFATYKITQ
jgi:hypothetical protein